jgi:hypothetical protein
MDSNELYLFHSPSSGAQFVLFGFRTNLASHFGRSRLPASRGTGASMHNARSPLIHSYGYGSAADRTNCLASFALNPEPFMKYAG